IKVDREEQEVAQVVSEFAVVENGLVPGVVETQVGEAAQRRLLASKSVHESHIRLDVPWPVPVPGTALVLLGIQVLFLAGNRGGFAEFEPAREPVVPAQGRRQEQQDLEARAYAGMQVVGIDVGRIDEEVWPHVMAA